MELRHAMVLPRRRSAHYRRHLLRYTCARTLCAREIRLVLLLALFVSLLCRSSEHQPFLRDVVCIYLVANDGEVFGASYEAGLVKDWKIPYRRFDCSVICS